MQLHFLTSKTLEKINVLRVEIKVMMQLDLQ